MSIDIYTTAVSILGSLWIIFKYFQQPKDNIGLLLIFVLAISDLFFASSILSSHFCEDQTKIHDLIMAFSMQFSIMWASGVSYIVYKCLQDPTLKKMRLFRTTLGIVILMSMSVAALYLFFLHYPLILKACTLIGQIEFIFSIFCLWRSLWYWLLSFIQWASASWSRKQNPALFQQISM